MPAWSAGTASVRFRKEAGGNDDRKENDIQVYQISCGQFFRPPSLSAQHDKLVAGGVAPEAKMKQGGFQF